MTRSSAKRMNGNARTIAAAYSVWSPHFGQAFTGDSARMLAAKIFVSVCIPGPSWKLDEVNWELCAELLNRASLPRAGRVPRYRHIEAAMQW